MQNDAYANSFTVSVNSTTGVSSGSFFFEEEIRLMRHNGRFTAWRCAILSVVVWFSAFFPARVAAQPIVSLSPASLIFGSQQVGVGSTPQVVTLTNTGSAVLSLISITISSSNSSDFTQINGCGKTLAINASCTINVTFIPNVTGNLSSTLKVVDNATGSPQTVPVSGTGVAPAVTLSPPVGLSFAGVSVGGSSLPTPITVSNTGTASLTVSSIMATGDFSQTNNCTAGVAAGSSCVINVTFSPTAVWSRGGSIVITDNGYNNPQQVAFLVGIGNSGAAAGVSTKALNFGSAHLGSSSLVRPITLSNTGSAALNINSIVASGDYSQTNNCPGSLNPATSCLISVKFAPSATGARSGYITINDTDPAFLQTVTLSGTGTLPNALVNVDPEQASLTPSQTEQFTVTITGVSSPNVTWSVDGVPGGNSTVGTISASGLYTAPETAATHIIQATNVSNGTQFAVAFLAVDNYLGTFTGKNDTLRTGQNLSEIALTTGNVNRTQFGKLFSYAVDGFTFAQPLYVEGVNVGGVVHNVVYVATENDSVFAFDADNDGTGGGQLWKTSFIDPPGVISIPQADVENGNDIPIQIGITGTPVIDPTAGPNGTLFVVVRTLEGPPGSLASYVQRLHALDLTTGAEQPGSPVVIQATVSGTGIGSSGGQLSFNSQRENSRPALLLSNGTIYVCWSSLEDIEPYHGWVMGFTESTLQPAGVFATTANGEEAGIWQGGDGATADAEGNVFVVTGNGTFDAGTGGVDYGDSVVKLTTTNAALAVGDYFSPFNQASLSSLNWDLSAGGAMLLPDQAGPYPHVMLAAGKGSTVYELNRDFLGGFSATANQNLLTLPAVLGADQEGSGNRGGPAYWQEQVYYVGSQGYPMQFSLQNGLISTVPIVQSNKEFGYPGGAPVVSANGNTNGIVWVLQVDRFNNNMPAVLRAEDAANVSRELYNSSDDASRDNAGPAVKFTVPTVANGKVYVPTQNQLDVYGLLP
jgi:hypothetical protein